MSDKAVKKALLSKLLSKHAYMGLIWAKKSWQAHMGLFMQYPYGTHNWPHIGLIKASPYGLAHTVPIKDLSENNLFPKETYISRSKIGTSMLNPYVSENNLFL